MNPDIKGWGQFWDNCTSGIASWKIARSWRRCRLSQRGCKHRAALAIRLFAFVSEQRKSWVDTETKKKVAHFKSIVFQHKPNYYNKSGKVIHWIRLEKSKFEKQLLVWKLNRLFFNWKIFFQCLCQFYPTQSVSKLSSQLKQWVHMKVQYVENWLHLFLTASVGKVKPLSKYQLLGKCTKIEWSYMLHTK